MTVLMLLENDYATDFRVQKEVMSLHELNHNVIVAAISRTEAPYRDESEKLIVFRKRIPSLIWKSSVGALRFPMYFSFWKSYVSDILGETHIDSVHVHDLPLAKIGNWIKKNHHVPFVLDLHENWPDFLDVSQHTKTLAGRLLSSVEQWRKYEKHSVHQADRVVTVVSEMRDRLVRNGAKPEKIVVLENTPLKADELKYPKSNHETTNLVYVGGVTLHRGLQYVIEGLSLLDKKEKWIFKIAGDGKYLKTLSAMVLSKGLEKKVLFLGKVPKAEAEKLVSLSDIAILPHLKSVQTDNSSPNKLFEYMAAGVPVIASNCASIERILRETRSGKAYIHNSPEDFAMILKEMIHNPDSARFMGENGYRAVTERYNWKRSSEDFREMYRRLRD